MYGWPNGMPRPQQQHVSGLVISRASVLRGATFQLLDGGFELVRGLRRIACLGDDIAAAATSIGGETCDAVFLSCTNLRTLDIIDAVEQAIDKPVLSSNQVLAWHLLTLTQCAFGPQTPGRLFSAR